MKSISEVDPKEYTLTLPYHQIYGIVKEAVERAIKDKKPSQKINVTSILLVLTGAMTQHQKEEDEQLEKFCYMLALLQEYFVACYGQPAKFDPIKNDGGNDKNVYKKNLTDFLEALGEKTPPPPNAPPLKEGEKRRPNWTYALVLILQQICAELLEEEPVSLPEAYVQKGLGDHPYLRDFIEIYTSEGFGLGLEKKHKETHIGMNLADIIRNVPYEQNGNAPFDALPNYLLTYLLILVNGAQSSLCFTFAALMAKRQAKPDAETPKLWWINTAYWSEK